LRSFCEDFGIPDALGPLYDLARDAQVTLPRDNARPQISLFSDALSMLMQGEEPTIAVIEDLHWADDATVDFVRYLGRRLEGTRLLLIVTARTDGAMGPRRLRRALADVPPASVKRIDVPLLSEAAVGTLAREFGANSHSIYLATGGNAFFVTELLQGETTQEPTRGVREAVLARLERLAGDARSAVDAVSVFPRRAEAEILSSMLDGTAGLDAAVDAGMIERTGNEYSFRHEIARRAVESDLPEGLRRELNAELLASLRHMPGQPIARLAHHAQQSGDAGAIAELAPAAGRWASSAGAHHQAAGHFEAALRISPDQPALLRALAIEFHMTGRLEDAIAAELKALSLHRAANHAIEQGASLRWLSRFSYLLGRRGDAETFGTQAISVLEQQPPGAELAVAYANMSQLEMLADHAQGAIEWGNRARVLGESLGREDVVCAVLNNMGTVRRWSDPATARLLINQSLSLALANNWQEHAARAYTNLGCGQIELQDLDAGIATLTAGIAYCAERDLDTLRLYMMGWLSRAHLMAGEWTLAQTEASAVLGDDLSTPLARFQATDTIARLRLRRGDPAAEEAIAELEAFLVNGREFQRLMPFATLAAERAWITGKQVAEALALLDEARTQSPAASSNVDLEFWTAVLSGTADNWAGLAVRRDALGMHFEEAVALLPGDEAAVRRALAIFEHLGAVAVADHAREVLAGHGIRGPRRSTLSNMAGLTTREVDVLRLLAKGISNKAIAASLGISPKTVDHHVSALITKLGADSRGRAVALAAELGLI
jgi:DNA-binding CsgD family transcriptional regulator/tetratricopeptide (TPR) repeat protein